MHQQSGECIYMQNMQNIDSELFCILISAIAYYFAYYSILFCILHCILHCILCCILQHIILHIYASICQIICQIIVHCLYSAYSAYCYMQNMQNMQWNVTDIFCILSIFQHIPTYWSAYFLAYFNIFSFIFPHSFSCIFLHIFFIEFSMKACNQKPKHRVYKPWEQVIVARQDFFQVLIRQVRISCWFEYDHTIIVTCKRKRKVMICIICIICTKIMNMHICI